MPRTSLPDAWQRFTRTYGGTASSADRTRARGLQAVPQDRGRLFSRMSTCERRPACGGIAPKPAGGLAKPWARVCLLLAGSVRPARGEADIARRRKVQGLRAHHTRRHQAP